MLIGAFAFSLPAAPIDAHEIRTGWCGDPAVQTVIPIGNGQAPVDPHGCCHNRACHAGCERKQAKRNQRTPSRGR